MKTIVDFPRLHKLFSSLKRIPGLHKIYRSVVYWIQHRENQKQRRDLLRSGKVIGLKQHEHNHRMVGTIASLAEKEAWTSLSLKDGTYYTSMDGFGDQLGDWIELYPKDIALLVFPSNPESDSASRTILDKACSMDFLEIGPKVYDLVKLEDEGGSWEVLVSDRVDLEITSKRQIGALMQRIELLKSRGLLSLRSSHGRSKQEVLDQIRNTSGLSKSSGSGICLNPLLFDFAPQKKMVDHLFSGGFESLRFTDVPWYRNKIYPYQSIPGVSVNAKRDMEVRWVEIRDLLTKFDLSLENRMVLDICCSSGIFMSYALSEGASWALGWDIPDVASITSKLQKVLGISRAEVFGAKLHDRYPLKNDIPAHLTSHLDESVIFLFSAVAHVGFIEEIGEIPWRFLVFEGHEADEFEDRKAELESYAIRWNAELLTMDKIHDGDSFPRPLAIIARTGPLHIQSSS